MSKLRTTLTPCPHVRNTHCSLCQVPQLSAVLRTNDRGSNPRHRLLLPTPVTVTSAATQTEPPQQYDYAYR